MICGADRALRRSLRLHRDVGYDLERQGDTESRLEELARHFTEAAALGEVDRAVGYCERAGAAAIGALAYEEAAAHFERALESLLLEHPVDEHRRVRLVFEAGNALHQINDVRSREMLHAAEEAGRELDDLDLLGRVVVAVATDVFTRASISVEEGRVALAEHVLARGEELSTALRARVMAALSDELFWSGDAAWRRRLCDDAIAIAREIGDPHLLVDLLASHNVMLDVTESSGFDLLEAQASEMIEVAAGIDDSLLFNALIMRIITRTSQGDVAAGDADLDRAEQLAERLRIPQHIGRAKQMRIARALLAGRLEDTDVLLADYEAHASRAGLGTSVAAAGGIRYRLHY